MILIQWGTGLQKLLYCESNHHTMCPHQAWQGEFRKETLLLAKVCAFPICCDSLSHSLLCAAS